MTHGIDARFRVRKLEAEARRRRTRLLQVLAGASVVVLIGTAIVNVATDRLALGNEDEELAMVEAAGELPPDVPIYVPAIVDLAGDPMWISLERGGGKKARTVPRPAELSQPGISPELHVLADAMLSTSERFMATIPSSQEDFAFFQAQRRAAEAIDLPLEAPPPQAETAGDEASLPATEASFDAGAGWSDTIDAGEAALPSFRKTEIENNTSAALLVPESDRFEPIRDSFVRILSTRSLESVVLEEQFTSDDAKLADQALATVFGRAGLEAGYVVALRGHRSARGSQALRLMQVSIYSKDSYIGTLARNAAGSFALGVDPWVRDDLFNYSGTVADAGLKRRYRLLDAIYSAAVRNNVPTGVIGEAIMHLSREQDLNAFASEQDRLILVYSESARGKDGVAGRVLYAGIHGSARNIECFVFQHRDGDFACITRDDGVRALTVTNGMVTPVSGVLTSTFGPRRHPILNTVRIHKGVDWAAPVGTPVVAAFSGEIVFQGDGGGYGNLVRISHTDGRETRYAHLQRFETKHGVGSTIEAGDVIGYVGTTGLSTGPHLHFELYQAGQAVDPLATVAVAASDGSAVEILTERIIQVESGGNVRAKNPLSSATGLGQFIESTWIRMMNTYRPDLARSLSRAQLLALRFDATLSREMVRNLAREGEAYLQARGHQITAGRLYLSHFLGMDGAHKVLSSSSTTKLVDVLGPGVIAANPFLTGKDAGYVIAWAERKMRGRGKALPAAPAPVVAEVRQTSPEFEAYKAAVSGIVDALAASL